MQGGHNNNIIVSIVDNSIMSVSTGAERSYVNVWMYFRSNCVTLVLQELLVRSRFGVPLSALRRILVSLKCYSVCLFTDALFWSFYYTGRVWQTLFCTMTHGICRTLQHAWWLALANVTTSHRFYSSNMGYLYDSEWNSGSL